MKASTYSVRNPKRLNCFQQIAVHLGGMAQAVLRQYPVNWTFHWRGICRAVSLEWLLARIGFALMNQLSVVEKRFPRSEQDIAADYFALRKVHTGTRRSFNEGRNTFSPVSHCDIAWAAALATHAHTQRKSSAGAMVA